jgi:zinc protease
MYGMALAVGLSVADVQGWQDVIQSITPEDIQTVAKAYLDPSRSTTGWLLNKEGTP